MPFNRASSNVIDRSVRGALAGAAGGLLGAAAKLLGELLIPPRAPGEPIPPAVAVSRLLEALSGSPLMPDKELLAVQVFHWTFSVAAGAAYGALVEFFPRAKYGQGVAFGLVLCLLTHESVLPWLGLSIPLADIPLKEHVSELLSHAMYGVAVEQGRRLLRARVLTAHPGLAT